MWTNSTEQCREEELVNIDLAFQREQILFCHRSSLWKKQETEGRRAKENEV